MCDSATVLRCLPRNSQAPQGGSPGDVPRLTVLAAGESFPSSWTHPARLSGLARQRPGALAVFRARPAQGSNPSWRRKRSPSWRT